MTRTLGVALVAALALAITASAQASTLSATYYEGSGRAEEQIAYIYNAAPGETNNLVVERSGPVPQGIPGTGIARTYVALVTFREGGGLITNAPLFIPGSGLLVTGIGSLCAAPLLPVVLCMTQANSVFVGANLGNGNDRIDVSRWTPVSGADGVEVNGGAGNDTVVTGRERDFINGDDGDDRVTLVNDGSSDSVRCGAGNDTVIRVGGVDPLDNINPDCEVVS
jgi:Ca2+-binding RTX toxin-like protein